MAQSWLDVRVLPTDTHFYSLSFADGSTITEFGPLVHGSSSSTQAERARSMEARSSLTTALTTHLAFGDSPLLVD